MPVDIPNYSKIRAKNADSRWVYETISSFLFAISDPCFKSHIYSYIMVSVEILTVLAVIRSGDSEYAFEKLRNLNMPPILEKFISSCN